MTNRELSQSIRNDLKAHGYNSRAVGVSVKDCGYSTSVYIKIKSPEISRKAVEDIINHLEEIEREERTYEILSGGNTFVFVEYIQDLFVDVRKAYEDRAADIFNRTDARTERISEGLLFVCMESRKELEKQLVQNKDGERCKMMIDDVEQLAELLYKFDQFGSIAA